MKEKLIKKAKFILLHNMCNDDEDIDVIDAITIILCENDEELVSEEIHELLENLNKPINTQLKWIVTDPSSNQMRMKIDEKIFLFKEDRIINPETKETEIYESEINLEDYSLEEMIEACTPFSYSPQQVVNWLNANEEFALIAECIFENEL